MKKAEIESKLLDLENRLSALGDIPAKVTEIEGYTERSKQAADTSDQNSQKISELRQTVQDTAGIAETINQNNTKYSAEFNTLKENVEALATRASELSTSIEEQLGNISSAVLSYEFGKVAEKLNKSLYIWLGMVIGSALILLATAVGVVVWEAMTANNFWNANFLIKVTLTAPIIYFLLFATRQYSKEKKLYEEYRFKSAVALSFEAYRKILNEVGQDDASKGTVLSFIIQSIEGIYAPPLRDEKEEKNDRDGLDITGLEKSLDFFKNHFPFKLINPNP